MDTFGASPLPVVDEPTSKEAELLASLVKAQNRTNRLLEEQRKMMVWMKRASVFYFWWTIITIVVGTLPFILAVSLLLGFSANWKGATSNPAPVPTYIYQSPTLAPFEGLHLPK